jgi:cell division protein FtsZ
VAAERGEMRVPAQKAAATPPVAPVPPPPSKAAIESAAKAAVAAALLPGIEDVIIHPIAPKPSLFAEHAPAPAEPPIPKTFIPPAPEATRSRPRRMPSVDELPRPAQAELRAQRGEPTESEHPEKRKLGLLRRLAAVGLGRRDEDSEGENTPANVRPVRPAMRSSDRGPAPAARPAAPPSAGRAPEPVSEYAKRPVHQSLDPLGRQAPSLNPPEDDQLEIPAFLRRQAN